MKFSWEENVASFCQNYEIRFHFLPQKSYSFEFISRPSIVSVIRFSNNSITFTDTIVKITKRDIFLEATVQLNSFEISQRLRKFILTRSLLKPNSRKLIPAKSSVNPKWRTLTTAKCLKKEIREN